MKIKNLVIIGDSYSTFKGYVPEEYAVYYDGNTGTDVRTVEQTWWHKFVSASGANLVLNDSWSGATVCYTGRVNPEYAYRSSFVNRMHLMLEDDLFSKKQVDTVFIFGATNDSWLDTTPLGEAKMSDWTEADLYYTLPAICYMIARLKRELPQSNIVFVINTELDPKIVETIKLASERFGTSFIELKNVDKISGHPTVKGMSDICEQILDAIQSD